MIKYLIWESIQSMYKNVEITFKLECNLKVNCFKYCSMLKLLKLKKLIY